MSELVIPAIELPRWVPEPRFLISEKVTPDIHVNTFTWRAPARFTAPAISFSEPQPLFVTGDKFTVLSERAGVIADSTYMFESYRWAEFFTPTRTILPVPDCPVLVAGNAAWCNYSHWLFQCFTPILLAREVALHDFHALVPPLTQTQRDCLALVGLGAEQFTELPAGTAAAPNRGVYSNLTTGAFPFFPHPAIIDAFERLAIEAPRSAYAGHRIYLSREDATNRIMINEAELRSRLEADGFTVLVPGAMSMIEQIAMFRDAAVIVGQHGAAMTNLLFAPRGGEGPIVIELQQENYPALAFAKISHVKGLRYTAIVCRMVDPGSDGRHFSTWEADIPLIRRTLAIL